MDVDVILQGDVLERLRELPGESVDCVVTSPPYWALRDYGVEGQLGLEPTVEEYIEKLCLVFDEVKRVLKKSGTCWVNLGDTYACAPAGNFGPDMPFPGTGTGYRENKPEMDFKRSGLQPKCLVGVPERFSLAMRDRGWILRNEIIWHKPNCMPSSAKDRFTVDFEKMFFFVKSKKYWFDQPKEELITNENRAHGVVRNRELKYEGKYKQDQVGNRQYTGFNARYQSPTIGKTKRSVWTITTQPYPEAHFATFPEALVETPIKAGCPEFVCKKCGKARFPILKPSEEYAKNLGKSWHNHENDAVRGNSRKGLGHLKGISADYRTVGYTSCNCNAGFEGGICLDPFIGAGTTALVALKQNKRFIGFEINKEYIKIAMKRIKPFLEQTKLI
ncbi:hypothetical protein LCGC14_0485150 [marine sediment metagenome]|uniref:site-specific DNA-methyltransferase (cytosine-N(4)-specific) n=1 Tax=marine sediment metagenome TaxID=412755 RepID=A0A0F9SRI6_9ZZZZ